MSYVMISGTKLATKLHERGMSQKALADAIGTTRHQVCRWCVKGGHSIFKTNANLICETLDIPMAELLEGFETEPRATMRDINDQEMAIIKAFRAMSPVEKARLVIALLDKDSSQS